MGWKLVVFIVKINDLTVSFGRKYFVWPIVSILGCIWPHISELLQSECFHAHFHKYASVPESWT